MGLSTHYREEYNDIKTLVDELKYHEHKNFICVNVKMINFLLVNRNASRNIHAFDACVTAELSRNTGHRRSDPSAKF